MTSHLAAEHVIYKDIQSLVERYEEHVPDGLKVLDKDRYDTIPDTLQERKSKGDAHLLKSELERLVSWKIKHGKFRPMLPKLVASNPESVINDVTRKAFKEYSSNPDTPEKAVKMLNELKGIGPATSSLLLSIYNPSSAPFFSDEFFRYVVWNRPASSGGWGRKLKYDMKELSLFYREVAELLKRVHRNSGKTLHCVELEKAAYVLGKENADLSSEGKGAKSVSISSTDGKRKREDEKSSKAHKRRAKN